MNKLLEQLLKDFNPQDHMSGEPLPGIELISTPEPEQQYWWYDRTGSTMTEEWKSDKAINMQGNSNRQKQYIIEQPNGTKELITNMAKYCREHNLQNSNLNMTLTGIRKDHKGYKAYAVN
jgi:hypothetical protein